MTTEPAVTLSFDVPLSVARMWTTFDSGRKDDYLYSAAREAVAKWEAEHHRYVVRATNHGWVVDDSTSHFPVWVVHFHSVIPNAEAEARALAARLNGEAE